MIHPKINQRWVVKNKNGVVLRRIRILGPSPVHELEYLYITEPARMIYNISYGSIYVRTLENIWELEQDVCDHRGNVDEWYGQDSPVPTHHVCLSCGDKFPNTADDSFWFPKALEPIKA